MENQLRDEIKQIRVKKDQLLQEKVRNIYELQSGRACTYRHCVHRCVGADYIICVLCGRAPSDLSDLSSYNKL